MEDERSTIEFTDRYGGRTPSYLRGCFGQCEAMGWVPIRSDDPEEPWHTLWMEAEKESPSEDGWHFVKCPSCHGTGRVSWIRTIIRIPWWLVRASRQTWMLTMHRKWFLEPNESFGHRLWFSLKICFWLDILRIRN